MIKNKPDQAAIDERAKRLLNLLVEKYISDGEPVASSKLAGDKSIALSAASVRNIMMDLEKAGFIVSPHTSAGRIPTAQGYRFFVENILKARSVEDVDITALRKQIAPDLPMQELLHSTSRLLSQVTHLAGIITIPRRQQLKLKQIDLLPLSYNRVLCVIVFNEREVEDRIIHTDRVYTKRELEKVSEFFTQAFADKVFDEPLKKELLRAMQQDRAEMEMLLKAAMDVAEQTVVEKTMHDDYLLEGEGNLLQAVGENNFSRLRQLFDMFAEKQRMLGLLDKCVNAEGIQIFIGEESGYQAFGDCSLITAPYYSEGQIIGVLGVLGPTRMSYEKVISVVDVTAKLLSAALKEGD